jgi:hypothetical protein
MSIDVKFEDKLESRKSQESSTVTTNKEKQAMKYEQ